MTTLSPYSVGSVETRRSTSRPSALTLMRPSCGSRRSAMFNRDMIFNRLITAQSTATSAIGWVGIIAKGNADEVLISGHDGGTGLRTDVDEARPEDHGFVAPAAEGIEVRAHGRLLAVAGENRAVFFGLAVVAFERVENLGLGRDLR